MALDKDLLGTALFNLAQDFNNKEFEDIDQARLDFWKGVAGKIIEHIQSRATLNVPGTGLTTSNGPVTGTSITGTIL